MPAIYLLDRADDQLPVTTQCFEARCKSPQATFRERRVMAIGAQLIETSNLLHDRHFCASDPTIYLPKLPQFIRAVHVCIAPRERRKRLTGFLPQTLVEGRKFLKGNA